MPLLETKGAASAQGFGEFAKSGPANYIEEVFSTYLYTGNGATQSINNGIDLSTKGGLVWVKVRDDTYSNALVNTIQGGTGQVSSNSTAAQAGAANDWDSFTTTGFNVKAPFFDYLYNQNTRKYVSWSFRKQAKFFDIVTYTGNGANRTITHNLGSVPGCIIIKRTDTTAAWAVYHRSLANTEYLVLNTTAAKATGATYWNSTTPTATEFSLGTATDVNANTGTYVAYLFAHDAGGFGLTGTDNVISCGSFTASITGQSVTLGYEPQWLLLKKSDATGDWRMLDIMRGFGVQGADNDALLQANNADAENAPVDVAGPTATGFRHAGDGSGATYIYIAIRRGPMKVPTSGTSVFSPITYAGNGTASRVISGLINVPDWVLYTARNASAGLNNRWTGSRLQGGSEYLLTEDAGGGVSSTSYGIQTYGQASVTLGTATSADQNASGVDYILYNMGRAPSFFDVVCYSGTGSNTTQTHNLGAVPELMLVKRRGAAANWQVYSAALSNTEYLVVNSTAAKATGTTRWNSTTPTASVFSLGTDATVNASGSTGTYVAYLFATCAGVSKVGSYTGTGNTLQIDCGFTGGARFILIKRTDSTGDWYVYDSARGIVSGNDPYLLLNNSNAEVTNTDWVDTHNPGFELSNAAGNNVNINTATYIFLAIA